MKKVLLGAAAALAAGAPATALANTSGLVDAGYEMTEYDGGGEFDVLHLGGAFQHDFAGWGIQADGRTVLQEWDGSSGNDSHAYAALHAYTGAGGWDFAGYVGILNYYGDGAPMIGGETRTEFGNLSLQGSLGYAEFDEFFDYSAWDLGVSGQFFFTPNFALTGQVGRTDFDTEFTDYEVIDVGIGAAFQFANAMQIYGGYIRTDGESDPSGNDYEADTFRIGFRYNINGGTMQEVQNDGASWNGAARMHEQFMRW